MTAKGDLEELREALNNGLDAGLTVNEVKEVLVQLYAYCGFPRSLNGISTLMSVLEGRKKGGVADVEGRTAAPVTDGDKYERGRKTLETLTGQPQSKPAKGFGEFSPTIEMVRSLRLVDMEAIDAETMTGIFKKMKRGDDEFRKSTARG